MAAKQQPSAFELERLARIERNRQRMAEMDIPTLAAEFNASIRAGLAPKRVRGQRQALPPRAPTGPIEKRRSSRLANVEPVEYSEAVLQLADSSCNGRPASTRAEEVYTEAHVQALGDHQEAWELFQDGYDAEGNRVYDKANGQTCHQCRQKTLGLRTACSGCQSLKGVFCGDCLFMRYGENVKEAVANSAWTCPSCRDICNCSLCRIRKGWAPTGSQYRRAVADGFKSVAHMLILSNVAKPAAATEIAAEASAAVPDTAAAAAQSAATEAPARTSAEAAPAVAPEQPALAKRGKVAAQRRVSAMLPVKRLMAVKTGKPPAGAAKGSEHKVKAVGLSRVTRARTRAAA